MFWRKTKPETQAGPQREAAGSGMPDAVPPVGEAAGQPPEAAPRKSIFERLKSALGTTRQWLKTDIRDLWKSDGQLVDEEFLRGIFAILVRSDMGGPLATQIRDRIQSEFRGRKVHQSEILELIRSEIRQSLQERQSPIQIAGAGPTVILVVGVNGSGKTTSIAKLAHRFTLQGKRVLLGAGDTFRAAAVHQLQIWTERIGCDIVLGEQGGDPGTVAFRTCTKAREEGYDVCILDTAGRLQTQTNLMQQLDKIRRVAAKQIEGAPHEVLLVLDATAGQNALSQAKGFSSAAGCTGIVLAKLDGTAKGGVVLPILHQFGLPVKLVGVGEKIDDLVEFDPDDFSKSLFDLD